MPEKKFQVGDLVLVMVNKVEASSVDQIIIEVDAKESDSQYQ